MLLTLEKAVVGSPIRFMEISLRMYRMSRAVHPGSAPRSIWRATRLLARQVMHRNCLSAWHGSDIPALQEMIGWRPSLVSAVGRPYINTRWDVPRRLGAIEQHYRQVSGRARALRIAPHDCLQLASVTGRGRTVDIVLDSPAWFAHEGELTLNLFLDGERIYSLAFSLGWEGGAAIAYVGALQGMGCDRALSIYRELTRALHGLRPRDLLIAAFRMLCTEVGIQCILAVDDHCRVSRSDYFKGKPDHGSYDAVWHEQHGVAQLDGFFEVPIDVARRTRESIPARKRSEYRQRYEMLNSLQRAIAGGLQART